MVPAQYLVLSKHQIVRQLLPLVGAVIVYRRRRVQSFIVQVIGSRAYCYEALRLLVASPCIDRLAIDTCRNRYEITYL